jgi:aminopeptidase N
MKENDSPKTVYLKEYRPPAFLVDSIDLEFDLDPAHTRVKSALNVRRNPASDERLADLALDGEQLTLVSLILDGQALSGDRYRQTDSGLVISGVPETFRLEIETEIRPEANTSLEGLYVSSGNFCTQCEAEGFRKITFYLDRPDVMARFTTTIRADHKSYPVLLSNGNPVAGGELDDGRHWQRWEDPFPKPCYLFALVAGDLVAIEDSFTTRSGRNVALKIYVQAHNRDKCQHAMLSLQNAMRWDEQTFGLEYDLDIYMIVAVDDFNMGAMENKGLNVFNSKFVLAKQDTATDADYEHIEGVIGHEYFHNWTGNRVTCRDWFQLSLKEGLTVFRDQEFSADMSARALKRIQDVRLLRTVQFAEDTGPMAHPIRPDSYIEINNFYTATVYEKGAEVIRMMHTLLGTDGFRKGMDLYFQRHDGQAVTTEDFVSAMEDANKADLRRFRLWYSQAGTPEIKVSDHYDAGKQHYLLTIKQVCPPTPGQPEKLPIHIPVVMGLINRQGQSLPLKTADGLRADDTLVLNVTRQEETFEFQDIPEKPVPSLLRGFSAPVRLKYDYTNEELRLLMNHDSDSFNRWEAAQEYALRVLKQLIADIQAKSSLNVPDDFIDACADLLESPRDPGLLAEALSLPGEKYLAEQMSVIDPQAAHRAREFLLDKIAATLYDSLRHFYDELSGDGIYRADPESIGRRRLKNVCLALMMQKNNTDAVDLCVRQYRQSDNMTDTLSALTGLIDLQGALRDDVLDDFYRRFRDDTLVMDKWFSLQAMSKRADTLKQVNKLLEHPAFSIKNPNKVRALIGAFCMSNPARFHDESGEAYSFLADRILQLDPLNPQIASRLTGAFNSRARCVEPLKGLMQAQLERILAKPGLSRDVYEIVSKNLKN